ncbi:MAG TPA: hydantoinase/oxoprolinase family protein [Thermoleophilaceae bacterium]|nr:hydantoinase/oxoprolinase family protein [Thermoleophilaceae bacterium]
MILGVDVGGTFTDAVAIDADSVRTGKAPTTPDDQSLGVMAAIEQALGERGPGDVERLVHGMTVGTNALLEGRTARTALIATEGFVDVERLGRQARPELYRLCADNPAPIVPDELLVAAPERCVPDGVLTPLDGNELRRRLAALPGDVEAVAICLLWGFRHPEHEQAVEAAVAELLDGVHVSTSHDTAAVFREYERCVTTIVDATVSPLLGRYIDRLTARARSAGLPSPEIMLSSGGVVDAPTAARHGSWTVLSGPAGGAVAAAAAARESGAEGAVTLDMGGTSCDVSLVLDGHVAVTGGREIAGRSLALPMVDVHTVGAGGGSLAWRDEGGALRVGPHSAGARPGPACYGHGGTEPTVTDASLLAGHLDAGSPLAGGIELDRAAAEAALGRLAGELGISVEQAVGGTLRVAAVEMAQAARVVTVERGIDPRGLTLVAFGGAGPLHAAAIAAEIGIERIVAPAASGVLSALGLAVSERRRDLVESVLLAGDELTREAVAAAVERLGERGRAELGAADAELRATYELRYAGQAFELPVEAGTAPQPSELRAAFDRAHADRYGYSDPDAELELVTVRVAVALPSAEPPVATVPPAEQRGTRRARFGDEWHETSVFGSGRGAVAGPAIVELPGSTLVVPPGWSGTADAAGVTLCKETG